MKRYDCVTEYGYGAMEASKSGEWVEHEVAQELLEALEDLLEPAIKGGYFNRVYRAQAVIAKAKGEVENEQF